MSFRTDLARAAQVADEKFRSSDRDKGLFMFLKSLYAPGPIVWKGYTFTGLRALGEKMVVTRTPAAYGEILQKQIISHWLKHTEGVNADANTVSIVDAIEKTSQKEPELACYWFGNSFAAKKSVQICGQVCSDLQDVLRIMFRSAKSFYDTDGYEKLMDRKAGAAFYGFLYSFGFRQIIDAQWAQAQKCDEFNKACLLLSMLDSIAAKVGADSSLLRSFFTDCGPVGIAVYTRQLVTRNQAPVYSAMNSEGQQLLSQIAGFRPVSGGSVEYIYAGGANALGGTTVPGSATLTVGGSASVDFIFLAGKNANCSVTNDAAVTLSGDAKRLIRISGRNGNGADNTSGMTSLTVATDTTVDYLDYVDKLNLTQGTTLNIVELAQYEHGSDATLNFLTDGGSEAWTALSGAGFELFQSAKFQVNGETVLRNAETGVLGESGYKLDFTDDKFIISKLA